MDQGNSPLPPFPVSETLDTPSPDELWRLFAPAVAAFGRVRVAQDGRQFRRVWERNLVPDRRPTRPAAVRTYDRAGDTRCVVFDLDCKKPGVRATVLRDCERLSGWLAEAGCAFFVDESPSGGRHVYVPLDHKRSQSEIAPLMKSLRASGVLPTLDAGPMVNLTEGCIRPPGAAHRLGGYQRLVTPLNAAAAAATARTTPAAWEALVVQLPPAEVTRVDVARLLEAVPAPAELAASSAGGGPARPLSPYFAAIAVTGQYDTDRYGSPSQARAAVVLHAVGRGWAEQDVRREMDAGRWPGLSRLYTDKYGSSYAGTALYGRGDQVKGDLGRAAEFIAAHPLHRSLTSASRPRRGATESPDLHLRKWAAALYLALAERRWEPALGYGRELVLLALADAARRTRRREVEHGIRHLSMNAGTVLNPSSVASHLRALRIEDDPFILLLDSDRGAGADVYELVIPQQYADRLPPDDELPPVPRGVHPVFGRLSKPAYRLHTALSSLEGTVSAGELAEAAHMPVRTVWAVLAELATHQLVTKLGGGLWRAGRRSLDRVARTLGIPARLRDLVSRWREERDAWRITLGLPARDLPWPKNVAWPGSRAAAMPGPGLSRPPPLTREQELAAATPTPPDWHTDLGLEEATAIHLLQTTLGAELLIEQRPPPAASAS